MVITVKCNDKLILENFNFDSSVSSCVLMTNGKSYLCKELKKHKINTYCLEKANYDISNNIIDDLSKLPYIKGLLKKICKSDFIVIDDLSSVFNYDERCKIFEYLKQKNKKVLYLTSNVEDIVNFFYTKVVYNKKVVMEGETKLILKEEKLMKLLGYSLPFYVDLSIQLSYYGLLDKICYNKEELEEALWKQS